METLLILMTILVILKVFEIVTLYVVLFNYAIKKLDKDLEDAIKGD